MLCAYNTYFAVILHDFYLKSLVPKLTEMAYKPSGSYKAHRLPPSRDIGQMVYNYKRVVKGLGCMNIKGLG